MTTIGILARGLLAAFALVALPALAQTYPAKPIRFIVPFTPGTGMDILARTIGEPLGKRLGQPVVVENKPGASGNLGSDLVAKSPPDGYTLMVTANTFTMTPALYKPLPYDPINDFAPVGRVAVGNLALVVNPALGVNTVAELIALAKRQPGQLNYASPGNGTPQHLAMESFKQVAGVDIMHIPYKGSAGAVTDVVGGQVPMMVMPVHTALPFAAAGRLKVLAVSGDKRSAQAPNYPTFREAGVENLDVDLWYSVLAPARTPREVVLRLQQEIGAVLALPDIRDALIKQGLTPAPGTPDDLAALIKVDLARWQKVVTEARIAAD
jgi:tripartite-type tricarboxylate transporter receptor subunit TctC